jgi:beta-aspartyl-peptidase (threonine type)
MIVVHGGAGKRNADDDGAEVQRGCLAAARLGHAVLERGGSALDAVIAAVTALEDDPLFNAGTGSALNADGEVEMDASVMTGELQAGAVAAIRAIKNPIRLARLVMERTTHVLLAADGAHRFAREQAVPFVDPTTLVTERALRRFHAASTPLHGAAVDGLVTSTGTVGAVACDKAGRVAAATSTGGTTGKMPGRVGDTPLIGCGTYADALGGACSCTGFGEAIIKVTLARSAVDGLRSGLDPMEVAKTAVATLERGGGDGGLILVDAKGRMGLAFNTQRMARAWVSPDGRFGSGFD